ncbi:MAG: methylphosphotriester-DNA--protein-cysteine methyltransferase family protein [Lachnospiraceae bacterium]|nr:methylphosphotriester-DNA--protein-cysteine methyltransferase family protein [Lachnospiraceae bacterium]
MTQEQWNAIKNRDRRYDDVFFYGVKTTKHVCRPSCPSRLCNPKNVIIFNRIEDALRQGYTPCLRCRPEQAGWRGSKTELTEAAKAYIQAHYMEKFSLKAIALALYVNENYLLRIFKETTGQTLLAFHNDTRCLAARELLTHNELSISYISDSVGYATSSHFARTFRRTFGCTPSQYRKDYFASISVEGHADKGSLI